MGYNCGVYKVENILDGKMYIGGSINLKTRKSHHFGSLKRNVHYNSNLQAAYNLNSKKDFEFIMLLYCESFEIERYEQALIDVLRDSKLLYNIYLDNVNSPKGIKRSPESKARMSKAKRNISDETRKKMSESGKKKIFTEEHRKNISKNYRDQNGEKNPMYGLKGENHPSHGKKHTQKAKNLMRERHWDNKGRNSPHIIKEDIVLEIINMINEKFAVKNISEITGVSKSVIYKIKNGWYDNIYDVCGKLKNE